MDRAGARWAEDEIAQLIQSVRDHGTQWRKFVHLFDGRSKDALRKKYRQLLDDGLVHGLVPEVADGLNQHGVRDFELNQHPEEEQLLDQNVVNHAPAPEVNPAAALLTGLLNATTGEGGEAKAGENLKEAKMSAIKIVVRKETISEDGCIKEAIKEEINRRLGGH